jgi:hypothetical protein
VRSIRQLRLEGITREMGFAKAAAGIGEVHPHPWERQFAFSPEQWRALRAAYPHRLPPLRVRAKNCVLAVWQAARALLVAIGLIRRMPGEKDFLRSKRDIARCLAICSGCEFWRGAAAGGPSRSECARCGCKLQLKTRLSTWHCPINKW